MADTASAIQWALKRIAQAQGAKLDNLRLQAGLSALNPQFTPAQQLQIMTSRLGVEAPQWLLEPDAVYLPMVCHTPELGWGIVREKTPTGRWKVLTETGVHEVDHAELANKTAMLALKGKRTAFGAAAFLGHFSDQKGFIGHVYQTIGLYRKDLIDACIASAFIGVLALATSLFSMQVYDRVIPTRSEYTLIILASGVLLTILIELAMKFARAKLMDYVTVGFDGRLTREIFSRLLNLRVDQLPASVGSLAAQVRGYEQVRSFYTASTLFTIVDLPLALLFVVIIMLIAHPVVAAVPLVFGVIALYLGLTIRKRVMRQAMEGAALSNMKTGLLVEAVEGIETIKSGAGAWKFLSRWIQVNRQTIHNDLYMRTATEHVNYMAAAIQQISYAGLVVAGSVMVMNGHMTMGALIASSIISGRILTPIMMLPNLLLQHAHTKAALEGLEKLYQLKIDNEDSEQALTPEKIIGNYQMADVVFAYADNPPVLSVPRLRIQAGERVVILGTIGAGKSTLLRLLSGMYQPVRGRVLIDDLDMAQVHRQVLTEHVGYLQQDHRLFLGTLRENLLIGMPDPGDEAILAAMRRSGMDQIVAAHPKGLERAITEGGKGLSGGQKQLLAFTRLILANPSVLLLDEPTATMDEEQERRCLRVLAEEAQRGKTMVVVTHKTAILPLATRIIVVAGSQIVMDGPRDAVLQELNQRAQQAAAAAAAAQQVAAAPQVNAVTPNPAPSPTPPAV